jgi:parallel beta-helix repeat protein
VDATSGFPVHNISTGLNYATIQSAINAIQTVDGNLIKVDPGTYNETLSVYKGISLVGDTPYDTIVNGQVAISESNISVTEFGLNGEVLISQGIQTIEISQNVILGGVKIGESGTVSYCNISKNTINGTGVNCRYSDHCVMKDNEIKNCYEGISIDSCIYCTIEGNDINGNTIGIDVYQSKSCLVTENSIHNNYVARALLVARC